MAAKKGKRKILICKRCGYQWFPRINKRTGKPSKPTLCASCRSPYWDKPIRFPNRGRRKGR